ncbi:Protein kinase [Hanseniaspora vineae]
MSQHHQHSHNNNRIGKYQIIKTLGEGSFGKVKLAYYEDNKVALKIISTNKLKADDMRGRIDREIQFLRLLRHPHIIKLYDVMKSPNEIIMVMEFAQNELFDYIVQRDKMSEQEARRFFQQIISAVEYCHRLKIVHRDLKPENLLLDDNLNVKIADFGLSNIMTDGNFLKTSCGSPNYASPEVISGKLYAGPEVDVWSCGVILYVMLCRRLPFDDESIPVLFKNISNGVYTLPKFLSPGAANLIKKMLIVNPLNRITVDEIFEDEWFKVDLPEYLLPKNTTATNYTTKITPSASSTSDNKRTKYDETFDHPIDYNDNLVAILSNTLGYDPEEVKEALTNTSPPAVKNPKYVEIRHAYLLIKDNQELIHDLESSGGVNKNGGMNNSNIIPSVGSSANEFGNATGGNMSTSSAGSSTATTSRSNTATPNNSNVPSSFNNDVYPDETSTISILPSSLPSIHRANMMAKGGSRAAHKITPLNRTPNITTPGSASAQQYNPTNYASLAPPTKMKKTKWHFGIRSRSYPLDVMGEIYIALKNLGAEWCRPSEEELWTIRVRWKYESNNNNNNNNNNNTTSNLNTSMHNHKEHSPDYMRMVIQLFQIEPNNYLVDFKFNGWEDEAGVLVHSSQEEAMNTFSAYPFLHLTTRLIMELAVNSG